MYSAIVDNENYKLRDGTTITGFQFKNLPDYNFLNTSRYVLFIEDGIVSSITPLSSVCKEFYIDNDSDDDEAIVAKINSAYTTRQKLNREREFISNSITKALQFSALNFTDEQAIEVSDLYPVYEVDHAYKKDERFTYNGRLFKVNQDHTSAEQWVPGETGTESLYTCLEMAGDGYLVWTQPTGAHNAYNTGDIVHYPTADDPLYKSLIDGNTTVPGSDDRWWELYTEE